MPSFIPLPYPVINGQRPDFASLEFTAGALPLLGVQSIDYANVIEPGEVFSNLPQKIGETRGQLKPTASFEILEDEYNQLITQLCQLNGTPGSGFMEVRWDLTVRKQLPSSPSIIVDVLRGCRIKSATRSNKSGSEALMVKVDLSLFYVIEAGQVPLSVVSPQNPFISG